MFFITILFTLTGIQDNLLPQPTKEQVALIRQMGSDDFATRQKADERLAGMQLKAILALKRFGVNDPDAEIAHRSKRLIKNFYSVTTSTNTIPCITGLYKLKQVKLPNGKTHKIPKGTARERIEFILGKSIIGSDYYEVEYAAVEATPLYVKYLLDQGYDRKDVVAILDAMQKNSVWSFWHLAHDEDEFKENGELNRQGHEEGEPLVN